MMAPLCPVCKTAKHVQPQGCIGDLFFCRRCQGVFDSDPNEGGDFSDHNPASRLERAERQKGRKRR